MVLNSAYALDLATITCFLLVAKFPPRTVQFLKVDLWSTTNLTWFALV